MYTYAYMQHLFMVCEMFTVEQMLYIYMSGDLFDGLDVKRFLRYHVVLFVTFNFVLFPPATEAW